MSEAQIIAADIALKPGVPVTPGAAAKPSRLLQFARQLGQQLGVVVPGARGRAGIEDGEVNPAAVLCTLPNMGEIHFHLALLARKTSSMEGILASALVQITTY